jgi:hypothetical protein
MDTIIKQELIEFKKYHKNVYNIYFHILCGFVFMSCLLLLSKNYMNVFAVLYSLLIAVTTHNIFVALIICVGLVILVYFMSKLNLTAINTFLLFLVFYFLPDISHYFTNEPSMLNMNNITPISLFTNVFYLLPFSFMSLSYSK